MTQHHLPKIKPPNSVPGLSWPWVLILLCGFIAAFGILSVYLGQDANFDLKNYHLYNAFQFLHDRLYRDLNAAGYQSFFNPLLDVPYYTLATAALPNAPRLVAFIMGGYAAAMALAVVLIVRRVAFTVNDPAPFAAVIAAIYIGLSGTNFISQVGTTFNDVPAGALILYGVVSLLSLVNEDNVPALRFQYAVLGGALFGMAAGLKLTTVIYAPAAAVALFVSGQTYRRSVLATLWFLAGCGCAFLLMTGWWNGRIFAYTGNPFFPLFNQIFRSNWYPPIGFFDERFKPRTLAQVIAYPFYWIRPRSMVVTEEVFADPRFAFAYISAFLIALTYGANRFLCRCKRIEMRLPRSHLFILSFMIVSFAIWEALFSIYRYAVALEVLVGIPILVGVMRLGEAIGAARKRNSLVIIAMFGLAIFVQRLSVYPHWGRVPYGREVFSVDAPELPAHSLVIVGGLTGPNAYVLPFLKGTDLHFVGITGKTVVAHDYRLWKEAAERISHHAGPLFVLERFDIPYFSFYMTSILRQLHVMAKSGQCQPILTNFDKDITLCAASASR